MYVWANSAFLYEIRALVVFAAVYCGLNLLPQGPGPASGAVGCVVMVVGGGGGREVALSRTWGYLNLAS